MVGFAVRRGGEVGGEELDARVEHADCVGFCGEVGEYCSSSGSVD